MSHVRISGTFRAKIALVALSAIFGACSRQANLLPRSLYYLSGSIGDFQVWRLEADGQTAAQLTDEEFGVDDFAVSPADGSLALISQNQLILMDGKGENRRLIADGNLVEPDIQDYADRSIVSTPVFSPDGQTLAYAFDGLHLYDLATGQDQHILKNLGNLLGESFIFAKENYYPTSWSPQGDKLLIVMGYREGDTLAIMEPGLEQPFRRLWSEAPVCCSYDWTPDGNSILVANPSFGTHWPGLWKYDAETGEEIDLVATQPGAARYVGWPTQLPSGELLFFYGEQFNPEAGVPLVLVRSQPDGTNQEPVRTEEFYLCTALWSEDSSAALIVQLKDRSLSKSSLMQLVLVHPDGSPLQVLFEGERLQRLTWGP